MSVSINPNSYNYGRNNKDDNTSNNIEDNKTSKDKSKRIALHRRFLIPLTSDSLEFRSFINLLFNENISYNNIISRWKHIISYIITKDYENNSIHEKYKDIGSVLSYNKQYSFDKNNTINLTRRFIQLTQIIKDNDEDNKSNNQYYEPTLLTNYKKIDKTIFYINESNDKNSLLHLADYDSILNIIPRLTPLIKTILVLEPFYYHYNYSNDNNDTIIRSLVKRSIHIYHLNKDEYFSYYNKQKIPIERLIKLYNKFNGLAIITLSFDDVDSMNKFNPYYNSCFDDIEDSNKFNTKYLGQEVTNNWRYTDLGIYLQINDQSYIMEDLEHKIKTNKEETSNMMFKDYKDVITIKGDKLGLVANSNNSSILLGKTITNIKTETSKTLNKISKKEFNKAKSKNNKNKQDNITIDIENKSNESLRQATKQIRKKK